MELIDKPIAVVVMERELDEVVLDVPVELIPDQNELTVSVDALTGSTQVSEVLQ